MSFPQFFHRNIDPHLIFRQVYYTKFTRFCQGKGKLYYSILPFAQRQTILIGYFIYFQTKKRTAQMSGSQKRFNCKLVTCSWSPRILCVCCISEWLISIVRLATWVWILAKNSTCWVLNVRPLSKCNVTIIAKNIYAIASAITIVLKCIPNCRSKLSLCSIISATKNSP